MPAVEKLTVPVWLVWGADDEFQPVSYRRRLAETLRNLTLTTIDGAGHFLPQDRPAVLLPILRTALDRRG
jgi:pimeloyl-ACP methyl ester carboxylesterase